MSETPHQTENPPRVPPPDPPPDERLPRAPVEPPARREDGAGTESENAPPRDDDGQD